jgi:S1-C subfamily serine protease
MKKTLTHIASFILGVAITFTTVCLISSTTAEPTPIPSPTPIIKEVIKEVEVVKEVVKEVEVIRKTDLEEVVASCKNSCVMIYAHYKDVVMQGSGWIYNGYVITAKHGIEGAKKIEVFTDDTDNPRVATVHYIDPDLDLAVLKAPVTLPSLALGDSNKLIEGEKLVSISCPGNIKNMVDECVNSGIRHYSDGSYIALSENSIGAGSSGGAVFNYNSEVIALLTNQDLAVPINTLKPILENLK